MKKISGVLIVFVFISVLSVLGGYRRLIAQETSEEQGNGAALDKAVNIGNKICPVSGESIDEETKATYEYEGKIYNFCCPTCIEEFKKDPQKYIKKVEEELQVKPQEQETTKEQHVMPEMPIEGIHEGHHGN